MKAHRSGFTLIELLLVFAIISLLAGILYAALGPVRERSRQTVCASNLRQIHQALMLYREDYSGVEPSVGADLTASQLGFPLNSDGIISNLKNKEILYCPDYVKFDRAASSYFLFFEADDEFTRTVKNKGVNATIVYCDAHNPVFNLPEEPRWTTHRVLVLRFSGKVDNFVVPLSNYDKINW